MSDLTERLRSKRSCTVCDGDGIKSNGKECGGCRGSGEVYRHDRTGTEAAETIDRLTRELAEARRERDLLAYHVAPHTDEEFRSSHCAEQIIDAGLQVRQRELAEATDKALEEAAKALEEYEEKIHYGRYANLQAAQDTALEIISLVRALKEKP